MGAAGQLQRVNGLLAELDSKIQQEERAAHETHEVCRCSCECTAVSGCGSRCASGCGSRCASYSCTTIAVKRKM